MIGAGANGRVFMGLNEDGGSLIAVKEMTFNLEDEKLIIALESEINLMRTLNHAHIVRYLGTEVQRDEDEIRTLFIFTEWVPGGSLESLVKRFGGGLAESVVSTYTRQILTGLAYLHNNHIIHQDIKGANCLVDEWG
jgi:serine/threonine protein kinase